MMPVCGRCKNWHDTNDEVRACYGMEASGPPAAASWTGPREPEELRAGVYQHQGRLYMVKKAIHGSGRMYAMLIRPECVNCGIHARDHSGSACTELEVKTEMARGLARKIRAGERLTRDQAAHYGAIYGICTNCGATLTDPDSIRRGMGSTCWSNYGRTAA